MRAKPQFRIDTVVNNYKKYKPKFQRAMDYKLIWGADYVISAPSDEHISLW